MSILAGYNSSGSLDRNPDGTPIIGSSNPNNPISLQNANAAIQDSNNYGIQSSIIKPDGTIGNWTDNAGNTANNAAQNNTPISYTNLESTRQGNFDPKQLSAEQINAMQNELMGAGYDLPKFGADSQWGDETQGAYNQWASGGTQQANLNTNNKKADLTKNSATDGMLNFAVNNTPELNTSVDQTAINTINDSNDTLSEISPTDYSGESVETDINTQLAGDTTGADAASALKLKKAGLVGEAFGNMNFGEYDNFKLR